MSALAGLAERQLWNLPTATSTRLPASLPPAVRRLLHALTKHQKCTPFTLPANGVIALNPSSTITLSSPATFSSKCTDGFYIVGISNASSDFDFLGPFYSSTTPLVYVVGVTTILAWVLLIFLLITPGTPSSSGSRLGAGFFGAHGIIRGVSVRQAMLGPGSRPWLQKVAALSVAISLQIVTVDTFKVAQSQYASNFFDASEMKDEVAGSTEVRVVRVISDVFLWLAQVQTLIRLFPRHKEKLVIKWIGFLLIILDVVFSCLNSFLVNSQSRPRSYTDAIPALSYLFQLALSLLYASWVFYYVITKRRYAFYHSKMPNICIVASMGTVACLIPVVFFVADVAQPDVGGFGDYFRWVGAAAASIIVWEWVERIEALERDEKKDGILGREVFEGDEMLDVTPSSKSSTGLAGAKKRRSIATSVSGQAEPAHGFRDLASRLKQSRPSRMLSKGYYDRTNRRKNPAMRDQPGGAAGVDLGQLSSTTPPVDRTNNISAGSTVYAVHYHPINETPPPPHGAQTPSGPSPAAVEGVASRVRPNGAQLESTTPRNVGASTWLATANPFKRKRTSPPLEVRNAMGTSSTPIQPSTTSALEPRKAIFARLVPQGTRRTSKQYDALENMEPMIIPAPVRGRVWSPDILQQTPSPLNADLQADETAASTSGHGTLDLQSDTLYTTGSLPSNSPGKAQQIRPLVLPPGSLGVQLDSIREATPDELGRRDAQADYGLDGRQEMAAQASTPTEPRGTAVSAVNEV